MFAREISQREPSGSARLPSALRLRLEESSPKSAGGLVTRTLSTPSQRKRKPSPRLHLIRQRPRVDTIIRMPERVICDICGHTVPPHAHYIVKIEVYADPSLPALDSNDLEEK